MHLKVHRMPGAGEVVAACDAELLDVTLAHGDIEICITGGFYGTERAAEEEVKEALSCATNANIIGKRVVALAIAIGLIAEEDCIMIGDVPHAQIFRI
ncbi:MULTISPECIES: DUF424 domain-containing protein [unclassified Methanoculleus]|uniref:DUF424 domain-containing protein n=1 Tax=unclassified Methanoculleus TaxID=2619537 RepID=UPI0025F97B12|nr:MULTISPECIES: DUF424 domain-containing protein [unclassified Methanoculleus]MCK9316862.1 DUF424 domain-containing protein [Methanoculleus sp.]MDD2253924.1 DUF424 domain-containing protein [Methanoculleus sp.]MDD2786893.1 DUF424 domain-containing protein [Methanoculleus sp.]MDD3215067.1 DUF424 domain-containing protein [Methanoculleus sp.]MDD4313080.1 DUF424 domain-containing protein [Methanoculleus sp.]